MVLVTTDLNTCNAWVSSKMVSHLVTVSKKQQHSSLLARSKVMISRKVSK